MQPNGIYPFSAKVTIKEKEKQKERRKQQNVLKNESRSNFFLAQSSK